MHKNLLCWRWKFDTIGATPRLVAELKSNARNATIVTILTGRGHCVYFFVTRSIRGKTPLKAPCGGPRGHNHNLLLYIIKTEGVRVSNVSSLYSLAFYCTTGNCNIVLFIGNYKWKGFYLTDFKPYFAKLYYGRRIIIVKIGGNLEFNYLN